MKVIVIAAEKGGVGKSTMTATLAVIASLAGSGSRVAMLDLDPQGSLTVWWNSRAAGWPFRFNIVDSLVHTIHAIESAGAEFLFIDTGPGLSRIRAEAIRQADLVIIPTGAGKLDLAGIDPTAATAELLGVPYRIVLNGAGFRTRLAGEAIIALRQRDGFLWPPVYNRQPITRAMCTGRTVVETEPDSPGATEFVDLWRAVADGLGSIPARRRWSRAQGRSAAR